MRIEVKTKTFWAQDLSSKDKERQKASPSILEKLIFLEKVQNMPGKHLYIRQNLSKANSVRIILTTFQIVEWSGFFRQIMACNFSDIINAWLNAKS